MSVPQSLPSEELIKMVRTLADTKARMPRKEKGILSREYNVVVEVQEMLGALHYRAGGRSLTSDLRFIVKGDSVFVRRYKPGDWEPALRRAYDDLVAQSGGFERSSVKPSKPIGGKGKGTRTPSRDTQPQKKRGFFDRLLGMFLESED